MSSAIIVPNTLPPQIIALSDDALALAQGLASEAKALVITDAASLEVGNALFRRIDGHKKGIERARLELTRPIDALKAQVIEAERQATAPLEEARADLGKRLLVVENRIRAERAEAERRAREDAEARARAERERLEGERQAIIRRQTEDRAAAQAKAAEEAALFGTPEVEVPAQSAPPPVVVVPVAQAVAMPELPKSAVRRKADPVLVIVDADKIPREIGGKPLWVLDEKAIKAVWKAGISVPGTRMDQVEGFAAAGWR